MRLFNCVSAQSAMFTSNELSSKVHYSTQSIETLVSLIAVYLFSKFLKHSNDCNLIIDSHLAVLIECRHHNRDSTTVQIATFCLQQ